MNRPCKAVFIAAFICIGTSAQTTVTTSGGTTYNIPAFNSAASLGSSPIYASGGNIGIGTAGPLGRLDIRMDTVWGNTAIVIPETSDQNPKLVFYRPTGTGSLAYPFYIMETSGGLTFAAGTATAPGSEAVSPVTTITSSGNLGIGNTSPGEKLEVNGNIKLTSSSGGHIVFTDGSQQSVAWTGVLSGGDYAESVGVTGDRTEFQPGDLLVIDPKVHGHFQKASTPYSSLIGGVYATKPGVTGRRQPRTKSNEDEVPMAMVGIVPTKVSTENGPIHDGDLLVSSSTPGYAMKGTDDHKLTGAVLGKALGTLDSGQGVIEVLISLQ